MTESEHNELRRILTEHTWDARLEGLRWLDNHPATQSPDSSETANNEPISADQLTDEPKRTPRQNGTRTDSQHKALFLWFSMIEHEAQNQGVTWNQLVGQTHQLKITKEGLHDMAKQLAKALWGVTSTKELRKTGHIDDLIDHFTDLFAKVGLELPAFPSDDQRHLEEMKGPRLHEHGPEYPDEYKEPLV